MFKVTVDKDQLLGKLNLATRFTSAKIGGIASLQGVLLQNTDGVLHLYSTNLTSYFHTTIPSGVKESVRTILDTRRIVEFLNFLDEGDVSFILDEKSTTLLQQKNKGVFPSIVQDEFPLPPTLAEPDQTIRSDFFSQNVPLVLFAASRDEARPALSGINFLELDDDLCMVATDGFRLSVLKAKKENEIRSMLIPAEFLSEILKQVREEKEVRFVYSPQEKIVRFTLGDREFYSRLIEGEFPPFERVIPAEKRTTVTLDRDEFLRNTKLISVFAREQSNIVVCEFKKGELVLRPKAEAGAENTAQQDIELQGEEMKVAFNFKFLIDFLNMVSDKRVAIELLRPDAPVVFKIEGRSDFIHIIMPVRIQE